MVNPQGVALAFLIVFNSYWILVSLCGNQLARILFLSTSFLILKTGVGEPHPFFWRSFSSSGAPRHSCEKSAGCFVFFATVCDIFFVNLGKLTSVWRVRHLARFLVLSGEVFVFQSSFPHDDALQNGWWKTDACPLLRWRYKRWFFFTRSGLNEERRLHLTNVLLISNTLRNHIPCQIRGDSHYWRWDQRWGYNCRWKWLGQLPRQDRHKLR